MSLRAVDNLDDRKEAWHLLHRLSPRRRVAFAARCAAKCRYKPRARYDPDALHLAYRCDRADERLTNEVYADLLLLACSWGLDLAAAAVELEMLARGRQLPPLARHSPHQSSASISGINQQMPSCPGTGRIASAS